MLTVGKIYELALQWGMEADPRGNVEVKRLLGKTRKKYNELKKKEKEEFDTDALFNPYSDTRILYGDKEQKVENILIGIDMEVGEILLADRLREKGEKIDLVVSHHPEGYAWAGFYGVMNMQADILHKYGVPINVAEGILKDRIQEVERKVMPANHQRAVDCAKLLGIPFICIHTPADNLVTTYLQSAIESKKLATLKDLLDFLKEIPEYKEATGGKAGPKILVGGPENKCGKIFVDMTGGTEGSKKAPEKLVQAGVGTVVGMHMGEELRKKAEKNLLNVIIAGHIASDNIGLNLFLDKLSKEGKIKVTDCSGFRRVERVEEKVEEKEKKEEEVKEEEKEAEEKIAKPAKKEKDDSR